MEGHREFRGGGRSQQPKFIRKSKKHLKFQGEGGFIRINLPWERYGHFLEPRNDTSQVIHQAQAYPGFLSMKPLGVSLSPSPPPLRQYASPTQSFFPALKELCHCSCILKKLAKLFKIIIPNPFQSYHPWPSLFLVVLESTLGCFSSLTNSYF